MGRRGIALVAVVLLGSLGAASSEAKDLEDSVIHSDFPLWGSRQQENVWPRSFNRDNEFGCETRVFGDWSIKYADDDEPYQWVQLDLVGAHHCAIKERHAYGAPSSYEAEEKTSFIIELGEAVGPDGGRLEIWALQSGIIPGSDYTLLSRKPDDEKQVVQFDILQQHCPSRLVRKGPTLDVRSTDYCSVKTQGDVRDLARRMARLPPVATMTFVEAKEP